MPETLADGVFLATGAAAIQTREWIYPDSGGAPLQKAVRRDMPDGSKRYHQEHYNGTRWVNGAMKGPRPLYGLPDIAGDRRRPVIIVEGEKCVDAAADAWPDRLFTTWAGGSNAWEKTDWTPLVGREVWILADADDPGRKCASAIAERLTVEHGCKVKVSLPPGDDGQDVDDWIERYGPDTALEVAREHSRPYRRPGLDVASLAELRASSPPEVQWLVDDLLPADGISMLLAPTKTGKSTLVRTLAAALADPTRDKWLDRRIRTVPVLHLSMEERPRTVLNHYDAIRAPGDGLFVSCGPAPREIDRMEALGQAVEDTGAGLVILDPLFRWMKVDDGNDYAKVTASMDPLLEFARARKVHLMLLHHSRKQGGEYGAESLGSTALAASVDTILSLSRDNGRRVLYGFGRDGVNVEKTALNLDPDGWISVAGTKRQLNVHDVMRHIVEVLDAEADPMRSGEIQKLVGERKETVLTALRHLMQDGDVFQCGTGPQTRYRTGFRDTPGTGTVAT